MSEQIKEGDIVDVEWNNSVRLVSGRVLRRAVETGDLWQIEGKDGTVYAINTGSTNFDLMVKHLVKERKDEEN